MARWTIKNVGIKGVSMAVPKEVVHTADYDFFTQEEADVFDKTVGIKSRHIAPESVCASDMCQAAAEQLLSDLGWEKESIEIHHTFQSQSGIRFFTDACINIIRNIMHTAKCRCAHS